MSVKFIEKNPELQELNLQLNGVDSYITTKNCDSLKAIIEHIEKKI